MNITREEIVGIIGTAVFAVLLLLILIFSYFKIMTPPDELEGIPVMFGNVDNSFGETEPPMNEIVPTPLIEEPQIAEPSPEPPLITQENEPTIDVAAKREEERRRAQQVAEQQRQAQARLEQQRLAEERRRQEEVARKEREEEERRRNEINQQMSVLFGESSGNRGNTEGDGTQGVSTGNDTKGASSGTGWDGKYDLEGRSLGRGGLIKPTYSVNDYGTVVIDITVDPQGNVINARIGKGTNTPDSSLREEALKAARRTKFNSITSVNNQEGTITYGFKFKLE